MNYYNEFDPYAAQWLKNLIAAGHIPAGDVDERDIREVKQNELKGYTQCHFFAGIGGWPLALKIAGWPTGRPVWTGSCPCQPFSAAGKQKGQSDERHLWPVWFNLIRQSKPGIIFGEQVASAIAFGWLDGIADDLESEDYEVGAAVLPACGVGAPHKRDRLWFVANGNHAGLPTPRAEQSATRVTGNGAQDDVADAEGGKTFPAEQAGLHAELGVSSSVGDAINTGLERQSGDGEDSHRRAQADGHFAEADFEWIRGPDGKERPVKSGLRLLAHGVPARVGKLRAYGNAIVPQVAAEFIKATM